MSYNLHNLKSMNSTSLQRTSARIGFAGVVLAILFLHAVPALLAGLLSYAITSAIRGRFRGPHSRGLVGVEFLAAGTVGVFSFAALLAVGWGISKLLNGESLSGLMLTLAGTVQQIKQYLPEDVGAQLPDSVIALKELLASTLSEHAGTLAGVSTHMLHGIVLTMVGWIIGILASIESTLNRQEIAQPVFQKTWMD